MEGTYTPLVSRLLPGLALICLVAATGASAAPRLGLPELLAGWARTGGVGETAYQGLAGAERGGDWPAWLLRPEAPDGLAAAWLERGLFPDAVTLDWTDGAPVAVFGVPAGHAGRRLEVDRERGVPLLWRSASGAHWHFRQYRWRQGPQRRRLVPERIVVEGPDGGTRVFVAE